MKFIELFAGIGGFRYGLERCNQDSRLEAQGEIETLPNMHNSDLEGMGRSETFTCVWANEIDKYACEVYRKNYGEGELYEGDITKITVGEIPEHDMLVGGFPCQAFSVAGKRGGFDDTRGTLFFDIARILEDKRPERVLLENVKGLLSHDSGKTFQVILKVLSDIGYRVEWQILNSKFFGVPQNRERVFIIGHLRGRGGRQVFPFREDDARDFTQSLYGTKAYGVSDIKDSKNRWGRAVLTPQRLQKRQNGRRIKEEGEPSFTLTGQDIHGVMIREATKKGYAEAHEGDSINLSVPTSKTRRGRVGKGVAQTIDTGMQQHTLQDAKIRRLTPTECERLQGFPDGWTDGLSDTQRYKCLGNAVTTNVIEAIGRML